MHQKKIQKQSIPLLLTFQTRQLAELGESRSLFQQRAHAGRGGSASSVSSSTTPPQTATEHHRFVLVHLKLAISLPCIVQALA